MEFIAISSSSTESDPALATRHRAPSSSRRRSPSPVTSAIRPPQEVHDVPAPWQWQSASVVEPPAQPPSRPTVMEEVADSNLALVPYQPPDIDAPPGFSAPGAGTSGAAPLAVEPLSMMERPAWLPADWHMEVRTRRTTGTQTVGRKERFYYCPHSGRQFRSKPEVLNYLRKGDLPKRVMGGRMIGQHPQLHAQPPLLHMDLSPVQPFNSRSPHLEMSSSPIQPSVSNPPHLYRNTPSTHPFISKPPHLHTSSSSIQTCISNPSHFYMNSSLVQPSIYDPPPLHMNSSSIYDPPPLHMNPSLIQSFVSKTPHLYMNSSTVQPTISQLHHLLGSSPIRPSISNSSHFQMASSSVQPWITKPPHLHMGSSSVQPSILNLPDFHMRSPPVQPSIPNPPPLYMSSSLDQSSISIQQKGLVSSKSPKGKSISLRELKRHIRLWGGHIPSSSP